MEQRSPRRSSSPARHVRSPSADSASSCSSGSSGGSSGSGKQLNTDGETREKLEQLPPATSHSAVAVVGESPRSTSAVSIPSGAPGSPASMTAARGLYTKSLNSGSPAADGAAMIGTNVSASPGQTKVSKGVAADQAPSEPVATTCYPVGVPILDGSGRPPRSYFCTTPPDAREASKGLSSGLVPPVNSRVAPQVAGNAAAAPALAAASVRTAAFPQHPSPMALRSGSHMQGACGNDSSSVLGGALSPRCGGAVLPAPMAQVPASPRPLMPSTASNISPTSATLQAVSGGWAAGLAPAVHSAPAVTTAAYVPASGWHVQSSR